jgi:hypothetical protein
VGRGQEACPADDQAGGERVWGEGGSPTAEELCRPRVLLSHLPLWRPAGSECGAERSAAAGRMRYMQRLTFQTMLDSQVCREGGCGRV